MCEQEPWAPVKTSASFGASLSGSDPAALHPGHVAQASQWQDGDRNPGLQGCREDRLGCARPGVGAASRDGGLAPPQAHLPSSEASFPFTGAGGWGGDKHPKEHLLHK